MAKTTIATGVKAFRRAYSAALATAKQNEYGAIVCERNPYSAGNKAIMEVFEKAYGRDVSLWPTSALQAAGKDWGGE